MEERLVRGELPLQAVYEMGQYATTIVPVHLEIANLNPARRTDLSIITDAKRTVRTWYNEDMEYYLGCLKEDGDHLGWLEGYEVFRDDWELGGESEGEFLKLIWKENNNLHAIRLNPNSVILRNQHDEQGRFYTTEKIRRGRFVEVAYRNLRDAEFVLISPEKMRKYGQETNIARINESEGIAEVESRVFLSHYYPNVAKALLLRNFAVFYLNKLFDLSQGVSSSN